MGLLEFGQQLLVSDIVDEATLGTEIMNGSVHVYNECYINQMYSEFKRECPDNWLREEKCLHILYSLYGAIILSSSWQ